jgi:hypothetical protein
VINNDAGGGGGGGGGDGDKRDIFNRPLISNNE